VEGKCKDGWRHFKKFCYFFGQSEKTQTAAENFCIQEGGKLTSIVNDDEQSFLIGE